MKAQHPAHPYSVYRRRRTKAEIFEARLVMCGRACIQALVCSPMIVPYWQFEIFERVATRYGVWPYQEGDD